MSLFKRGKVWWSYFYVDGIRHQYSTETSNRRQADTIEAKLKEEVNALSALTFGVPKLLDSNASEAAEADPLFLVMEWISGPSLAQKLSAGPMAFDDALVCCTEILRTLGSMHRLPIVHRDLKPDNVILRDGLAANPVIVDFGLAWDESQMDRDFHSKGSVGSLWKSTGNESIRAGKTFSAAAHS